MLWLGFTLMNLQQLWMLARVPIISAYDPRRESMLAYASPSNKIAIMITGLVIDCLETNNFLVTKSSLLKLIQLCLYINSPYFLFSCSLLPCKPIQQHLQSTSSFILVLGKAKGQACVELYWWSIELEGIFVLPLAPRWVRHSSLSKTVAIPYTCGLSRPFSGAVAGEQQHVVNILVCACLLYH